MSLGMLNAAFGSDKPDLGMVEVVKNPALQRLIDTSTKQAGETQEQIAAGIKTFQEDWRGGGMETVRGQLGQESGVIDRIYSGGLAQELAQLRAGESAAQQAALDRTLGRQRAGQQLARARAGVGGRNTFLDLQEARMTQDTITNQALREAAQKRSDFGQVLGMQMGSMGKRQAMQREMSQLGLEEGRVMNTEFQRPMEMMQRVQQMDEANKFRSLYQKRDALQRMADMESVGMEQLGQLTEMAGNVGGAVAGFCWIAQVVYGKDNPKWLAFRHWLLTKASDRFFYAYALNGKRIAEMIRGDRSVIKWIRGWMDQRIASCP